MDPLSNSDAGDGDESINMPVPKVSPTVELALDFMIQNWIPIAASLLVVFATWFWLRRKCRAPFAPSSIFVPSTSSYPSKAYTSCTKISVSQFIDDFLKGKIELRDAHSGYGMEHVAQVVSFRFSLRLAWRTLYNFITTMHTERQDKRNMEVYVLGSDSVLEQVLGSDRMPLVGYIRDEMDSSELRACLAIQMERVAKEYLDLNPDDRLLDVHAQWGDLSVYLAHDYEVPTCAIVATASQLTHASNMSGESQVQRFLRFVTGDYRSIPQCLPPGMPLFTKVMAIDALDIMGVRNIPVFLRSVNEAMEVGGRFLMQVTTTPSSLGRKPTKNATNSRQRFTANGAGDMNRGDLDIDELKVEGEEEWSEHWWYHWFRQKYIQPGSDTSMLLSIEQLMMELQCAGFEVLQVESLTSDAALTTAILSNRLCAAKRQIEMELGEDAYRAWELYLNWTQSLYSRARLFKHFVLAIKRQ
ncbi:hypothetical protein GGI07_005696 [Coemansia sp. Benny D115]|nr:hypothetical protein GGI07_005696 [Coemansia sp. Benny D115]